MAIGGFSVIVSISPLQCVCVKIGEADHRFDAKAMPAGIARCSLSCSLSSITCFQYPKNRENYRLQKC
jgi:hypothetical protein